MSAAVSKAVRAALLAATAASVGACYKDVSPTVPPTTGASSSGAPSADDPTSVTSVDDVAAVPDLPIVDTKGTPVRAWIERKADGTVGIIRLTGQAPGEVGRLVGQSLNELLSKHRDVDGFASQGVSEARPVPGSRSYPVLADAFAAFLAKLADAFPRFVELREIAAFDPDPEAVPATADGGAPLQFRAPEAGPAFVPMRTSDGQQVWRKLDLPPGVVRGHVLSGPSDGAAWEPLGRLFADCTASPGGAEDAFFIVREPAPKTYEASCLYLVVGPYAEVRDPKRGIIMISTPTNESPESNGGEANQ